jgi:hypothetical protein
MPPVGIRSWISVVARALNAFVPPVSEYFFATASPE